MSPRSGSAPYLSCAILGNYLPSLHLCLFIEEEWHLLCLDPDRLSQNVSFFPSSWLVLVGSGVEEYVCGYSSIAKACPPWEGSLCVLNWRSQDMLNCWLCGVPCLLPVFLFPSAGHSGHGEYAPAGVHHCPWKGRRQQRSRTYFSPLPQENPIL